MQKATCLLENKGKTARGSGLRLIKGAKASPWGKTPKAPHFHGGAFSDQIFGPEGGFDFSGAGFVAVGRIFLFLQLHILFPCGHSPSYMPFSLVLLEDFLNLIVKSQIYLLQALGKVFMYGSNKSKRFEILLTI